MANNKWDVETTIKFIQVYKLYPCLWNFQSTDYKNKQKREAAYISIVQEMNISGLGVQEVKNKIKNLRSTYSQEIKKIEDSKKSGAGLSNVYNSNIKWLKEMEEVFAKDLKRKVYENNNQPTNEDTSSQANGSAISSQSHNHQEIPATTGVTTITTSSTTIATTRNTGNTTRAKKRTRDIVKAISDLKDLNEKVNSEEETALDMFGKSVAMQLKTFSVENALLAQCKIQSILTEFGIKDYRQRTASHSSLSNSSNQRPSSAFSDATDVSFNNDTSNIYQFDESSMTPSPQMTYTTPTPMTSSSQMVYTTLHSNSMSTNEIISAPMTAAFETNIRSQQF